METFVADAGIGKSKWIGAAVEALGNGGVEAVRVERLARALGVTKGSFYWHFEDRTALLTAVLDVWEREGTEVIIEEIERGGGDARLRVRRLWDRTSGQSDLSPELAIRDWARREDAVAERVRRVDTRRMDYLRRLLGEVSSDPSDVEARALLLYALLIGSHFISVDHGASTRAQVLSTAVSCVLGPPRQGD